MWAINSSIKLLCVALGMLVLSACTTSEKEDASTKSAANAETLKAHVVELASDRYEGRGAGYSGELAAAVYIANRLESYGLQPSGNGVTANPFFQVFSFHPRDPGIPWETLTTQNVVGMLAGTDLANEIVVIGAHHDGQGMEGQANPGRLAAADGAENDDKIWNSASDNATSVAAILELARMLAASPDRPRRTVMFVTFSAEEYALNGAVEYVSNPPAPLERHVAMINLEKLVGDEGSEFMTATTGASPAFDEVSDSAAQRSGVGITPFYPGLVTDTDHYPFVAAGVPAMVIGTGSYEHIHQPGDEAARLDYDLLAQRVNFIYAFVLEAANREGGFPYTANVGGYFGIIGSPPSPDELAARGLGEDAQALKVSAVIPNMPGDKAGIKPGDLIAGINGEPLASRDDGYFTLNEVLENYSSGEYRLDVIRESGKMMLLLSK